MKRVLSIILTIGFVFFSGCQSAEINDNLGTKDNQIRSKIMGNDKKELKALKTT